jgi:hypothetical protein
LGSYKEYTEIVFKEDIKGGSQEQDKVGNLRYDKICPNEVQYKGLQKNWSSLENMPN